MHVYFDYCFILRVKPRDKLFLNSKYKKKYIFNIHWEIKLLKLL